jgi:hypothetical protein
VEDELSELRVAFARRRRRRRRRRPLLLRLFTVRYEFTLILNYHAADRCKPI